MKLTFLMLILCLSQVVAESYAQSAALHISANNETLESVLKQIEKQSEFLFFYNVDEINKNEKISLKKKTSNIQEVLDEISTTTGISYSIKDRHIVLTVRPESASKSLSNQQESRRITGVIKDHSGEPVIGANVTIKGTGNGTITDIDGNFSLDVPEDAVLQVSYIGYLSQEITTKNQNNLKISLKEDTQALDEVIVIGYGTMKKSDLTGSVSSLRAKDMNKGVNTSVSGLLQGKAAGVQITQASAEPGGGITVQIRGAGSVNASSGPLYVIDGLPVETGQVITGDAGSMPGVRVARSPISNINPADIESIEVLKDASATAIYGARGANGVILVTTRKGASGSMKINYSGYAGIQSPKSMINVLNATDYQRIMNEILDTPGSNVAESERVKDIQNGGTNWQDELLRSAMVQSHSVSLMGGNDRTKYFASLNYFDQNGVLKTSQYQRYDGRVNLEHKSDKLLFGVNLSTSYTHDNTVPIGFSTNEEGSSLYAARGFDPTLRIFNEDGTYQTSSMLNLDNPLALLYGKTSETDNYRTLGTMFWDYTIMKGWTAKLNIGVDTQNSRRDTYVSRLTKDGRANSGVASILTGNRNNYLGELTSTYYLDLKDNSSLTAMGGITYQKFTYNRFNGTGRGFPVDESKTNNMEMGDASLYTMGSLKDNNKLLSYIGRVNYNLWDKFLLTATLRVDGSSRFGENNKYGYFPSGAFAWKMHQHEFIQNLNLFSTLKFRASVGRTGNQDIANYLSMTTFGRGNVVILDGKQYVSLAPNRLANPNLKWETTEQINVGFDMGFIQNRINVSVDYFQKNTFDMLMNLPIPASTGYSSVMQNVGNIKNTGFEFTIDTRNVTGDFTWNTSLNISTLKNRVTDIGEIPEINYVDAGQSTTQIAIIRKGETLNSFYGYKTNGIWQSWDEIKASGTKDPVKPGDVKYVDQNGDNVVNTSDRVILGKSFPSLTFGLTNDFSYKNFSLNVFVDGASGVSMLNNSKVETYYPVSHRRNRMAEPYLNRWTESNPSTKYPSFVNPAGQGNKAVSDLTVEDASYIRLQSVQLNYQVPLKNQKVFDHISLYVTGQNLLTWTKYSGQDPTTNSNGNSSLKIDFNSYPVYRTFMFGLELGF